MELSACGLELLFNIENPGNDKWKLYENAWFIFKGTSTKGIK